MYFYALTLILPVIPIKHVYMNRIVCFFKKKKNQCLQQTREKKEILPDLSVNFAWQIVNQYRATSFAVFLMLLF